MDIYGGKMMGIREKDFEDGVASKEETAREGQKGGLWMW